MKQIQIQGLNLWQFGNLSSQHIRHFVSERSSPVRGKEFTLSFSSSPDRSEIQHNRNLLASAMGVMDDRLFFPSQVHKTRIVHVTPETGKEMLQETDALITAEREVCIAVMSADCVPILLYDQKNHVAGAVHSGWRGTVAKILEKTLHEMKVAFGTQGKDLIAGIGPSVSQDSYEVGEEVVQEVRQAFGKDNTLMIMQPDNKAKLDLWRANRQQLMEFGVPESQIEIANLCTVKNNNHFFSARKGDAGRFAAGIVLL
ncbi:MAG TPA: peptidoglycan editing factor PgeF [Ohtaekwangia sp.]